MNEVAIVGWGLWASGFPSASQWLRGEADPEAPPATGALLDRRTKRRASPIARALADAYAEALAPSGLDPSQVGSVFGSALGEAGTMIDLLGQMWTEGEGALSPMRFATSVHNAASGVVSISTKNQGFTTSLGADFDTPAMALLEGMGVALAHGVGVVVACGDEAAPADLVVDDQGWGALATAVALVPVGGDESRSQGSPRMGVPRLAQLPATDPASDLERNPQAGMLDLIRALSAGEDTQVRLDRGRGRGFAVPLTFAP